MFGFGAQKTPESFRQACRRFIYTENLLPDVSGKGNEREPKTKSLQPPSAAIPIIKKVIDQMESEDGWVPLGQVGSQLSNLSSDFDPRTFGSSKLSDLIRRTGAFEIDHPQGGTMRIRTKLAAKRSVKATSKKKT